MSLGMQYSCDSLARARRELRRQAGEQRGVTEDVAARDHGDDDVLVHQFERAVPHDVELAPELAALHEHRFSHREDAFVMASATRSSSSRLSPWKGSRREMKRTRSCTRTLSSAGMEVTATPGRRPPA